MYISDGCAGLLGAHELTLSEQARQLAPVRLTGNFGSEVLRSMSTFKRNGPVQRIARPCARRTRRCRGGRAAARAGAPGHPCSLRGGAVAPRSARWRSRRSQLCFRTPYMDNRLVRLAYQAPAHLRRTAAPALRLDPRPRPRPGRHAHRPRRRLGRRRRVRPLPPPFGRGRVQARLLAQGRAARRADADRWPARNVGARRACSGRHKFLAYRVWLRRELAPYAAQVSGGRRGRAACRSGTPRRCGVLPRTMPAAAATACATMHAVITLEAVHRLLIDACRISRSPPSARRNQRHARTS